MSDCHTEHDELKGAIRSVSEQLDQVDDRLVVHVTEVHRTLVDRNEIEKMDSSLESEIEYIAEELLGKRRPEIAGGGRDPKGSIKGKIDALYHDSRDGGIKTRLSKGAIALLIALIGAVGTIGAALAAQVGSHQKLVSDVETKIDQRFEQLRQEIDQLTVP